MMIYLAMLDTDAEKELFEEIYSTNRKHMLKTAEGIIASGHAEDAVHDAFLRIAKYIGKFSAISCNERRYLCVTIVKNVALNMRRDSHAGKMEPFYELDEIPNDESVEEALLRHECLAVIEKSIGMLEPALKEAVNLRLVLGYSTSETAELLGITQEAVRTRIHRGKLKLKKILTAEGMAYE